MTDTVAMRCRALLGWLVAAGFVLGPAVPAVAATTTCGGGEIEMLQDDRDPTRIVGARVSGVGADCDGQPVGVQFLGNDSGDPTLPAQELARAYSDEDPCTGAERPDVVLRGGTVDVLLCESSATSGHVDGEQLTRLRLLTTAGTAEAPAPDSPSPSGGADLQDAAPAAPGEDLPMTGAAILRALLLGAGLVLGGVVLVRTGRREGLLRR